jgi:hypothetical protein
LGAPQHWLGKIDPGQSRPPVEHRQFEAGADADIEHMPAKAVGGRGRRFASRPQDEFEDEIVNRRPASIGVLNMLIVENGRIARVAWRGVQDRGGKDFLLHAR